MNRILKELTYRVHLTRHAEKRMKERLPGMKGVRRRERMAQAAYDDGTRIKESSGAERAHLRRFCKDAPGYENYDFVLYMDTVFIFDDNNLVTVLPYDRSFCRIQEHHRAKSHRKVDRIS